MSHLHFTHFTAHLSQPRFNLASTSVGDFALFAGGEINPRSYSNVVDIFDSQSMNWTTTNISLARAGLGATSVGKLAMFAGGCWTPLGFRCISNRFG